MRQLQQWYPDPPLVIFLSNNEHSKLSWTEVETDRDTSRSTASIASPNFKRKAVADGWIERYRALQNGMREGLDNGAWRERSIFVGYDAFGPTIRPLGRLD